MRTIRRRTYQEISPIESVLIRQKMGIGRYRKTLPRNPEKAELLLKLNLERIRKAEENDFISIGVRKRRMRFPFLG